MRFNNYHSNNTKSNITPNTTASKAIVHSSREIILDSVDKVTDITYLWLSMRGYYFDATTMSSASDATNAYNKSLTDTSHDGEGLIITTAIFLVMLGFGLASTKWRNNKDMQKLYKYARDILSGVKNGRHAIINLYFISLHLSIIAHHAAHIAHYGAVNPYAIAIGLALAPALVHYRWIDSQRNKMLDTNNETMEKLLLFTECNNTDDETYLTSYRAPKEHGPLTEAYMLALSVFNGVTDGPYMFGAMILVIGGIAGFGGLNAITCGAPVIALLVVLSIYTALTVISSVYTERQRQHKLQQSAAELKIEQKITTVQSLFNAYKKIIQPSANTDPLKTPSQNENLQEKLRLIEQMSTDLNSNQFNKIDNPELNKIVCDIQNTMSASLASQIIDIKNTLNQLNESISQVANNILQLTENQINLKKESLTSKENCHTSITDYQSKITTLTAQHAELIEDATKQERLLEQLELTHKFTQNLKTNIELIYQQKEAYQKKYDMYVGELKSRSRLKIKIQRFETLYSDFCGITTESDTQIAFNNYLKAERKYLKKYKEDNSEKLFIHKHGKVIDAAFLEQKQNEHQKIKKELDKIIAANTKAKSPSPVSGVIISYPRPASSPNLSDKINKINKLNDQIHELKNIFNLKETAGLVPPPSLLEWKLRYKTYCTEIIASEKKLFRDYQIVYLDDDERKQLVGDIQTKLDTLDKSHSIFDYFERQRLKHMLDAIHQHEKLITQKADACNKVALLILAEEILTHTKEGDNDFEEIKQRVNDQCRIILKAASSSSLKLTTNTQQPFAEQRNELQKIYKEILKKDKYAEPTTVTTFTQLNQDFDEIHQAQRIHLKTFSPGSTWNANASFRSVRGNITGIKNAYKIFSFLIEAFRSANNTMNEKISFIINTILKIIAYPAIALYGYYTARNQYKANKEKIGARSPRLFPSLTINMRLSNLDNEEASNDSIGRNSPFVTN